MDRISQQDAVEEALAEFDRQEYEEEYNAWLDQTAIDYDKYDDDLLDE